MSELDRYAFRCFCIESEDQTTWQFLFAYGPDCVLRGVAWQDGDDVRLRVLREDCTTFDTCPCCADLVDLWADESLYCSFAPALLPSLVVATLLLGSSADVLDHVPRGVLAPPPHRRMRRQ